MTGQDGIRVTDHWQPVTDPERAMLACGDDRQAYLTALASGPLLLPVPPPETDGGVSPAAWPTARLDGETHVLAFTSPEAIAACLPGQRVEYRLVSITDLASWWQDPQWWLAVDPGLPIGARVSGAELARLAATGPTVGAATGPVPGEEELRAAIDGQDPDALTAALLRSELVVPLAPDGSASRDVTDPDFPWWCLPDAAGEPSLPVFTSEQRLRQVLGDHDFVVLSSVQLAGAWPDPSWQLMLNPGTPLAASIPGESVQALHGWLDGLRTALTEAVDEERQRLLADGPPETTLAPGAPGAGTDGEPAAAGPDPAAPPMLQVVVPHRYVRSYLDQGYDRVAGLVHRWWGTGRETPRRLYERLDLLGDGSPFRADDDWAVVLRWPPADATEQGWWDGPPRMESFVVPDGAGLHKIDRDGGDEPLARFDAAERRWLPPDPPGAEPPPQADS
ncbi:SseB family protein [Solwaraspora sp. WMMD406]|uniref:SseB family protein n=1 Tax=Solwaraspora sp. WMMD406 TaxID=3016095 RepID=UPI0024167AFF|nr:SseB family protein [Solwaraspora sp. WMMD406]MDG4762758.1 SseB family protein [Solwaraspora sp. WMMD406]